MPPQLTASHTGSIMNSKPADMEAVIDRGFANFQQPAEHATTAGVHRSLLSMIVSGELAPGTKINQDRLAARLGVSRTPVVKALHLLSAQGLVDAAPNRGFRVHKATVAEDHRPLDLPRGSGEHHDLRTGRQPGPF